jgi:Ca2+-binding EF-hand superfamily protein
MNFFPKILKDEKEDIPDINENIFSKTYYLNKNHNNTIEFNYSAAGSGGDLNIKEEELKNNNIENNIAYNSNYLSPNEENEIIHHLYQEKENNFNNQNQKIILPKFPTTFGLNLENNENENEQQFINNMNDMNNNNINLENAQKDGMNFIINKNLHNNNINDNENHHIENHYDDIKFRTINSQPKMNIDMEMLINNENNNNLLSPKTYSYQIKGKGKENINIVNNLDIKNNINHHHPKKIKNKKCPNIIEAINNFLEYINIIILNENRIEHLKENLALREDLSLKEIFFLFDKDQNNYISINNFQLICKKVFNLFPTIDQVKLVFKRYKKHNKIKTKEKEEKEKENNGLNIEEFITMMTPRKSEYINIIDKKNKIDKTNLKLSVKSKKILNELIKCLLQKESDYYKIRNKFDCNCLELLWKEITKYSKNGDRINKKQMNKFLEKYGYVMQEKQIDNIFFIFDKEQKGKIKNNDFRKEMCSD